MARKKLYGYKDRRWAIVSWICAIICFASAFALIHESNGRFVLIFMGVVWIFSHRIMSASWKRRSHGQKSEQRALDQIEVMIHDDKTLHLDRSVCSRQKNWWGDLDGVLITPNHRYGIEIKSFRAVRICFDQKEKCRHVERCQEKHWARIKDSVWYQLLQACYGYQKEHNCTTYPVLWFPDAFISGTHDLHLREVIPCSLNELNDQEQAFWIRLQRERPWHFVRLVFGPIHYDDLIGFAVNHASKPIRSSSILPHAPSGHQHG